jgi:hypothetical protein
LGAGASGTQTFAPGFWSTPIATAYLVLGIFALLCRLA